jgi:hypothetical protein
MTKAQAMVEAARLLRLHMSTPPQDVIEALDREAARLSKIAQRDKDARQHIAERIPDGRRTV